MAEFISQSGSRFPIPEGQYFRTQDNPDFIYKRTPTEILAFPTRAGIGPGSGFTPASGVDIGALPTFSSGIITDLSRAMGQSGARATNFDPADFAPGITQMIDDFYQAPGLDQATQALVRAGGAGVGGFAAGGQAGQSAGLALSRTPEALAAQQRAPSTQQAQSSQGQLDAIRQQALQIQSAIQQLASAPPGSQFPPVSVPATIPSTLLAQAQTSATTLQDLQRQAFSNMNLQDVKGLFAAQQALQQQLMSLTEQLGQGAGAISGQPIPTPLIGAQRSAFEQTQLPRLAALQAGIASGQQNIETALGITDRFNDLKKEFRAEARTLLSTIIEAGAGVEFSSLDPGTQRVITDLSASVGLPLEVVELAMRRAALGTPDLLSVTEARDLGVPFGTSKQRAAQLGITPARAPSKVQSNFQNVGGRLIQFQTDEAGNVVGRQDMGPTQATGESLNTISAFEGIINGFDSLAREVGIVDANGEPLVGPGQRVAGFIQSKLGQAGYNAAARQWQQLTNAGVIPTVRVVFGEIGPVQEPEQKRAASVLPSLTMTGEEFSRTMKFLRGQLSNSKTNLAGGGGGFNQGITSLPVPQAAAPTPVGVGTFLQGGTAQAAPGSDFYKIGGF